MTPDQLTALAFLSTFMVVAAGGLFVRSLLLAGSAVPATGRKLRRVAPAVQATAAGPDFGSRVDHGFNRLILESGSRLTPMTGFLLTLAGGIIGGGAGLVNPDEPLLGIFGAALGMTIPLTTFAVLRVLRLRRIREELPHVIDMLARATRAGQSSEQAIDLVSKEAGGVLGDEFGYCSKQLSMGMSFDRCMRSLSNRVSLIDIRILTTTLVVQKQAGGRLSETLDRMCSVVRDRLSSRRQIKAATGAGRASTLTIAAIAPAAYVFVYMFHRPHLQIMLDNPLGRSLLVTAFVMELVGLAWVFALLREET